MRRIASSIRIARILFHEGVLFVGLGTVALTAALASELVLIALLG